MLLGKQFQLENLHVMKPRSYCSPYRCMGPAQWWRPQLPQGHREVSFQRLWATDTNHAVAVEEGKNMTDKEAVYLGQVTQPLWALGSEPTRLEF